MKLLFAIVPLWLLLNAILFAWLVFRRPARRRDEMVEHRLYSIERGA